MTRQSKSGTRTPTRIQSELSKATRTGSSHCCSWKSSAIWRAALGTAPFESGTPQQAIAWEHCQVTLAAFWQWSTRKWPIFYAADLSTAPSSCGIWVRAFWTKRWRATRATCTLWFQWRTGRILSVLALMGASAFGALAMVLWSRSWQSMRIGCIRWCCSGMGILPVLPVIRRSRSGDEEKLLARLEMQLGLYFTLNVWWCIDFKYSFHRRIRISIFLWLLKNASNNNKNLQLLRVFLKSIRNSSILTFSN